jgi:TRAP-type C4-dicarboxylate transport system permease small subunit
VSFLRGSFHWITQGIEAIGNVLFGITSVAGFLMVMLITVNIFLRYAFRAPLAFETETVQIMLITFLWLNQATIMRRERSIVVDIVFSHFNPLVQLTIKTIAAVLAIVYLGFIAKSVAGMMAQSFELGTHSVYISRFYVWPQQLIVVAGTVVACLQLIVNLIAYIRSFGQAGQNKTL